MSESPFVILTRQPSGGWVVVVAKPPLRVFLHENEFTIEAEMPPGTMFETQAVPTPRVFRFEGRLERFDMHLAEDGRALLCTLARILGVNVPEADHG